jgi:hypothetical protein
VYICIHTIHTCRYAVLFMVCIAIRGALSACENINSSYSRTYIRFDGPYIPVCIRYIFDRVGYIVPLYLGLNDMHSYRKLQSQITCSLCSRLSWMHMHFIYIYLHLYQRGTECMIHACINSIYVWMLYTIEVEKGWWPLRGSHLYRIKSLSYVHWQSFTINKPACLNMLDVSLAAIMS